MFDMLRLVVRIIIFKPGVEFAEPDDKLKHVEQVRQRTRLVRLRKKSIKTN